MEEFFTIIPDWLFISLIITIFISVILTMIYFLIDLIK